jgi:hypothetical protein
MLGLRFEKIPKAANAPTVRARAMAPDIDGVCAWHKSEGWNGKFCGMMVEVATDMLLSPRRHTLMAIHRRTASCRCTHRRVSSFQIHGSQQLSH